MTPLSIKYLIKSSETYEMQGRAVTVDPDSFLIINEGTEYASHIDSDCDVDTASMFIGSELLNDVVASLSLPAEELIDSVVPESSINFVERLYPRDNEIVPRLLQIRQLTKSGAADALIKEEMHSLTEALVLKNSQVRKEIASLNFTKASTREETYRRLHRSRDFMLSNLSKRQDLTEVAAIAGFAQHHFLRVFKEVFGATPHQYLTKLRLEKARHLVLDSKKSISEICLDVGFESLSSFSALYQRHFQMSPNKHRVQDKMLGGIGR